MQNFQSSGDSVLTVTNSEKCKNSGGKNPTQEHKTTDTTDG